MIPDIKKIEVFFRDTLAGTLQMDPFTGVEASRFLRRSCRWPKVLSMRIKNGWEEPSPLLKTVFPTATGFI